MRVRHISVSTHRNFGAELFVHKSLLPNTQVISLLLLLRPTSPATYLLLDLPDTKVAKRAWLLPISLCVFATVNKDHTHILLSSRGSLKLLASRHSSLFSPSQENKNSSLRLVTELLNTLPLVGEEPNYLVCIFPRKLQTHHIKMTGHLQSTGRGGAGNIGDITKSPKILPKDLETPTLKTPMVTTGRGGSGNITPNKDPAETRALQDVGP